MNPWTRLKNNMNWGEISTVKVEITKKGKRAITIILSIFFILTCILTFREIVRNEYKENERVILEYSIIPKVDSKVFLKNNDIYNIHYLNDDMSLVSDLISNIESTFNMEIKSNTADSIKANVKASIVLQSYYGEKDEILWTKTKELSNRVVNGDKNLKFSLVNTFSLDEYKTFLLNVFKQTELKPKTVLSVVWDIKGEAESDEKKLPINKVYKINMLISNNIFKIEKIDFKDSSENQTVKEKIKVNKNLIFIFLLSLVDAGVIILIVLVRKTKIKKEKSNFEKKKEQIFKDYSDRFARLEHSLHNQYSNIINMKDIIDLVRISDEIRQPIFYYEVDEEDEKKIEYFVFDEGRIYYLVNFDKIEDTIIDFIKKNN